MDFVCPVYNSSHNSSRDACYLDDGLKDPHIWISCRIVEKSFISHPVYCFYTSVWSGAGRVEMAWLRPGWITEQNVRVERQSGARTTLGHLASTAFLHGWHLSEWANWVRYTPILGIQGE